jgi:IrrE N-terminal-like domain
MVRTAMKPAREARRLLLELWERRREFYPADVDPEQMLPPAPGLIATKILGYSLEVPIDIREDVPSTDGICTAEVAGTLNRAERRICIAKKLSVTSKRFTLAHEIGHLVLHPGVSFHRDRPLDGSARGARPRHEWEADQFAAHLLMPPKLLLKVASGCFPCPIDGTIPDADLAFRLSNATGKQITARELANMKPLRRAIIVASISEFGGSIFKPLASRFSVSPTAMGIQLLELGIVV